MSVELLDRGLRVVLGRHLDEAEAFRATGRPVHNELYAEDRAGGAKQLMQLVLGHLVWNSADEKLWDHGDLLTAAGRRDDDDEHEERHMIAKPSAPPLSAIDFSSYRSAGMRRGRASAAPARDLSFATVFATVRLKSHFYPSTGLISSTSIRHPSARLFSKMTRLIPLPVADGTSSPWNPAFLA